MPFDDELHFQGPSKKIPCKNCIYRKKLTIEVDGKTIEVGATKSNCVIYDGPQGKPSEILFSGAPCRHFKKEE